MTTLRPRLVSCCIVAALVLSAACNDGTKEAVEGDSAPSDTTTGGEDTTSVDTPTGLDTVPGADTPSPLDTVPGIDIPPALDTVTDGSAPPPDTVADAQGEQVAPLDVEADQAPPADVGGDQASPPDVAGDLPTPNDTVVTPPAGFIADHTASVLFDSIPSEAFDTARATFGEIYYGHTSHGSQIVTGLDMLQSEDALYTKPSFTEPSDDLGHTGDLSWVAPTEAALADEAHDYKMVVWSWCGGCSDNTPEGIQAYLDAMNDLEAAYPSVVFVYMTGHLDGTGVDGTLYTMNDLIRAYCEANDKVLFDFADIESYDPAGTYYPDESDACGWCETWCASETCPTCGSYAHSHCFNCYQKGKAFWWLLARLSGWEG